MKKICYISTMYKTLDMFVIDFATYLHEYGNYEITFICNAEDQVLEDLPPYIHLISVKMRRGINFDGIRAILKMYFIFKKQNFDIVQYCTPNASLYASIAAYLAHVPHRIYSQWGIIYVSFGGFKRKIFKRLEKITCTLSTKICPDSKGNLNFSFNENLYAKDKGKIIWNGSACGVDLKKYNVSFKQTWKKEIKDYYHISDDAIVFGFVGRIAKDKGIEELLISFKKIIEKHDNVYLLIVGAEDGVKCINKEIFNWSKTSEKIIYCGWQANVEKYYSAMDVLVLPSYREGFGIVVIEAGAMHVPCIVTDIIGPNDVIKNNVNGLLVKVKDINNLKYAMEFCLQNFEVLDALGDNAYDLVTKIYNRDILFERKKEYLDKLF